MANTDKRYNVSVAAGYKPHKTRQCSAETFHNRRGGSRPRPPVAIVIEREDPAFSRGELRLMAETLQLEQLGHKIPDDLYARAHSTLEALARTFI